MGERKLPKRSVAPKSGLSMESVNSETNAKQREYFELVLRILANTSVVTVV